MGHGHSLQHIAIELLLAIAQELSNHLAAEAFPLEEEVGHTDGGVRDEATRDQELDALVRVSVAGLELGGERKPRLLRAAVLTPTHLGNLLPRDHQGAPWEQPSPEHHTRSGWGASFGA